MSLSTLVKGSGVITEGFDDIIKFFQEEEKNIQKNKKQAMKDACELITSDIKQSMIHTEKRKTDGIWRQKRGKYHYPSMPKYPPAVDFGNLIKSIKYYTFEDHDQIVGDVGSFNVDYAIELEYGQHCAPRPWLQPAIDRNQFKIEARFRAVITGIY